MPQAKLSLEGITMVSMKNFYTGMLTGVAIGAVAGMIIDPLNDKQSKEMRKTAKGVFASIGSVMDYLLGK